MRGMEDRESSVITECERMKCSKRNFQAITGVSNASGFSARQMQCLAHWRSSRRRGGLGNAPSARVFARGTSCRSTREGVCRESCRIRRANTRRVGPVVEHYVREIAPVEERCVGGGGEPVAHDAEADAEARNAFAGSEQI